MKIRPRTLPHGWYPTEEREVFELLNTWKQEMPGSKKHGSAGIVPHAGWYFSGKTAFTVFCRMKDDLETIVLIGGHLPKNAGTFAAKEDAYQTPLGLIHSDKAFLEEIGKLLPLEEDKYADNSVEVHLPMVKYCFPEAKAVLLRVEPSETAARIGQMLKRISEKLDRKVGVIGSCDLTHYGPAYGFSPAGSGPEAEKWVKEKNDRKFIMYMKQMDWSHALQHAQEKRSACSAGAAVTALSFAASRGIQSGELLEYTTSLEKHTSDSFVGYAGILYSEE